MTESRMIHLYSHCPLQRQEIVFWAPGEFLMMNHRVVTTTWAHEVNHFHLNQDHHHVEANSSVLTAVMNAVTWRSHDSQILSTVKDQLL